MWFVLALLCVVVAAQPEDRDRLDPFTPRRQQNFGHQAIPDPVGPLFPDGPEHHAQDPPFPTQTGGHRGYESESRPAFGLNQETQGNEQWQRWGGSGKPQRNGRAGRPSYTPDWTMMRSIPAPAGGARENNMNPLFGKPLSPTMMDNRQFVPLFKADNVTVQNVSAFHLKEGENVFLLPKGRGQMQQAKKGGVRRPQELGYGQGFSLYSPQPYMKIFYNPTATQKISFEYGITQLFPAFMKADAGK